MKIKDTVVININIINSLENELISEIVKCDNKDVRNYFNSTLKIVQIIKSNTKPLEPIIRDAYNAGNDWNEDIEGYLNNKVI